MNPLPASLKKPFRGILFDFDGTIIDIEELHLAAISDFIINDIIWHGRDIDITL